MFRFKQFIINDEHCAMKVGTDGVLLGAWANVQAQNIVDIGCGSGLIALMAAQRNPEAQVVGIEIDPLAAQDARQNVLSSPFSDRIRIECCDVFEKESLTSNLSPLTSHPISFICNPPFYTEDTLPPDEARAVARNNKSMSLDRLVEMFARHLTGNSGTCSLVLPSVLEQRITELAHLNGLHIRRLCHVKTTPRKQPKRILIELGSEPCVLNPEVLTLMNPDGSRSEQYAELCRDFYL